MIALIVKYCDSCHNGDIMRYPVVDRTKDVRKKCKKYHSRAIIIAKKLLGNK